MSTLVQIKYINHGEFENLGLGSLASELWYTSHQRQYRQEGYPANQKREVKQQSSNNWCVNRKNSTNIFFPPKQFLF